MEFLIGFIIVMILIMFLFGKLILMLTDKSAGVAITSYFKAAEYILEYHQPPKSWTNPPTTLRQRLFQGDTKKSSTDNSDLLHRMDDLIAFFEHSTFFQDEEARTALLEQLNDERHSWSQQSTNMPQST